MARIPTQEFIDPKTGKRSTVTYNDKEGIAAFRRRGFNKIGGVREDGCVKYNINTKG